MPAKEGFFLSFKLVVVVIHAHCRNTGKFRRIKRKTKSVQPEITINIFLDSDCTVVYIN
jgi:hypothetical protein